MHLFKCRVRLIKYSYNSGDLNLCIQFSFNVFIIIIRKDVSYNKINVWFRKINCVYFECRHGVGTYAIKNLFLLPLQGHASIRKLVGID